MSCLKVDTSFSVEINRSTISHTKKVISHALKFNQSYKALEENAKIVNSTPNASIRIPTSKYMLKKTINSNTSVQYHIRCSKCKNYSISLSSGKQIACEICSKKISTASEEFFIYMPIEEQLRKVIDENLDEVLSYPHSADGNFISDIHDGIQYKKACEKYNGLKVLSMVVCTDGAVIFKSPQKSLWAIQLYLNFLKPSKRYIAENVLVVGLHCTSEKPDMQKFFYPLLREMKQLIENGGFTVKKNGNSHQFMPIISHCCCDLPAKVDVQGMISYNGYNSCGYCLHPGISVKQNGSSTSVVRYIKRKQNEKSRTHTQMLNTYERLKSTSISGVQKISCLVALEDFDLIDGFCLDYMHSVLLGVVKKLMSLWLDSPNHKEPFYIKPKLQPILEARIQNIKPTREIARAPRSISEKANFKANEYRSLLLYYLPCSLNNVLEKRYADHFMLLSSAIYMLLQDRIPIQNVETAEKRLIKFADDFEKLYKKQNVTMNVHLMRHIGTAVRNLGPLWSQSAFAMEDNNGKLVKTTAKNSVLQSIAWKYLTRKSVRSINCDNDKKISVGGPKKIILKKEHLKAMQGYDLGTQNPTIYDFITLNAIRFTSAKSKQTATIDCYLKLKSERFGCVEFYFVYELVVYGLMHEYELIECKEHISTVKPTSRYIVFSIREIEKKLLYMKVNKTEYLTSIPNKFEKS